MSHHGMQILLIPFRKACDKAGMTSIEALVAPPPQDASTPGAGAAQVEEAAAPSLEAIASGDLSAISSQQDYQAAKAALSSPEVQEDAPVHDTPEDADEPAPRDEFGDELAGADAERALEAVEEEMLRQGDDSSAETDWQAEEEVELNPHLPQTVDELDLVRRETAEAIRQQRVAIANADMELRSGDKPALIYELNALEQQLEALDEHAPAVHAHQQQGVGRFVQHYQRSADEVKAIYPEASNLSGAFCRRMAEVDAALEQCGDPRFFQPDKPMIIAQMVAAELQMAPGGRTRATVESPQPPYASLSGGALQYLPPPVASGLARTSMPHVTSAEAAIASVQTPDQLDRLKLQLLGRAAF